MLIGKNIGFLRRSFNLTQDELASKISVSRQTISKWENGEVVPDSVNLIELSNVFNVKVDDLLKVDFESVQIRPMIKDEPEPAKTIKTNNKLPLFISLVLLACIIGIITFIFRDRIFPNEEIKPILNDEIETIVEEKNYSNLLSAGRNFSVYLDENKRVKGFGENTYKQLDFNDWNDVIQVSAGGFHTLGLLSNGKVLSTGYNVAGQTKVDNWLDVIQVSGGRYHSLGLKNDGTVLCVGENKYKQCETTSWSDIIQVSAGRYNSYGLKSDGTLVSTSSNEYGQANISTWSDIEQISAGTYHVIGLKSDGTVMCAGGQKGDGACNISSWSDIKQVVGAGYHSIGLKNDGTVVAAGNNGYGQLNVDAWQKVVAISGGRYHTVGLTEEGKFLAIGSNEFGQLDGSKVINDSSKGQISTPANDNSEKDENNEDDNTDKEGSESDNSQTEVVVERAYFDWSQKLISLDQSDISPRITDAIFNPFNFILKFSGETDTYIIGFQCGESDTFVFEQKSKLTNGKTTVSLDLSKRIIEKCHYMDIKFLVAEVVGYNDSRDYIISKWFDINERYLVSNDFERLFQEKSTLLIDSNYRVKSDISGRLDISQNKEGSDIVFNAGLSFAYRITNSGVDLKEVLTNYAEAYKNTNIPENFNLDEQFYVCNSVNPREKMITKCIPFKLDSIRLGLMGTMVDGNPNKLITYTQKWMFNQTSYNYRIKVEIPEFNYIFESVYHTPSSGPFGPNIESIVRNDPNFKLPENAPETIKIYVSVSAVTNGKYLESKPHHYEKVADIEDLILND